MRYVLPLLLVAILTISCSRTKSLRAPSQDSDDPYSHVNEEAANRTVRLVLASGDTLQVDGLHVAPDVTTWIDPETRQADEVPTADVRSVQVTKRGAGLVEGFGLGAVTGGGTGALVGAATYSESNEDGFCLIICSRGDAAIAGGLTLGVVGIVVGSVTGLARGSRMTYTPASDAPVDSTIRTREEDGGGGP